jgi:hypothetical protein
VGGCGRGLGGYGDRPFPLRSKQGVGWKQARRRWIRQGDLPVKG